MDNEQESKSVVIRLRVPGVLKDGLEKIAGEKGRTLSETIRAALRVYVEVNRTQAGRDSYGRLMDEFALDPLAPEPPRVFRMPVDAYRKALEQHPEMFGMAEDLNAHVIPDPKPEVGRRTYATLLEVFSELVGDVDSVWPRSAPDLVIVDIPGREGAGRHVERSVAERYGLDYRERTRREKPTEVS